MPSDSPARLDPHTFRFGGPGDELWAGEPGDVVEQHGPRIGYRYWLVIDVRHAKRWSHVTCIRLEDDGIVPAILDAQDGGTVWHISRNTITA